MFDKINNYDLPIFQKSFTHNLIYTEKRLPRKTSEALYLLDIYTISKDYSMIVATLPEPTVLPPSRVYGS